MQLIKQIDFYAALLLVEVVLSLATTCGAEHLQGVPVIKVQTQMMHDRYMQDVIPVVLCCCLLKLVGGHTSRIRRCLKAR